MLNSNQQELINGIRQFPKISIEKANKKPIRWFIKWYATHEPTNFYEQYKRRCLDDSSVGIHYNVTTRLDECKNKEDIQKKMGPDLCPPKGPGSRRWSLCYKFINEVEIGDWVVLGVGKRPTHLAQIDSGCYFSNDPTFRCDKQALSHSTSLFGYFHRRKLKHIMELPKKCQTTPYMSGIQGGRAHSFMVK